MIKINLLGAPKPKRGKAARGAAADMGGGGGEGVNPLVFLVVFGVIAGAGFYFLYSAETSRAEKLKKDLAAAQTENRQLAEVKATYERKQKEADNYKHRVDVIDSLRLAQSGPVQLLNLIGDTVNSTEAVWLVKMADGGNNTVSIDGTALSMDAIANLMANLKKTGYFKNVEMTESIQDDSMKDFTIFKFSLACERQPAASGQKS